MPTLPRYYQRIHPIDQAKPVRDSPELFAACFRCGASNPLLSPFTAGSSGLGSSSHAASLSFSRGGGGRYATPLPWGDACTTCRHPFVRSFFNFESLPLVEFEPDPGCAFSSFCIVYNTGWSVLKKRCMFVLGGVLLLLDEVFRLIYRR